MIFGNIIFSQTLIVDRGMHAFITEKKADGDILKFLPGDFSRGL
jgi:hypothetical protein